MATYFQKISSDRFDADAGFVVRESKHMRLFIGAVALVIAAIMSRSSLPLAIVIALFGLASLYASRRNRVVISVNKEGLFYDDSLVTSWDYFISARFVDEMPQLSKSSLGISDQFFIVVRYRKKDDHRSFERRIALTNTQDKSEEEIMAAIRFYYNLSQDKTKI